MFQEKLERLLKQVKSGEKDIPEAIDFLKNFIFADLNFAKVDHHRNLRQGFPEVILCQGKTPNQIGKIASEIYRSGANILATKAGKEAYEAISCVSPQAQFHEEAKIVLVEQSPLEKKGQVLVVSAGTSDIPIAQEAALTAEICGSKAEAIYDVGTAGLHRLLAYGEKLVQAQVIIVVAGMDGVLPSIIGGLVSSPVIAVPTSRGYGANFQGLAPLLTMLNSCAPGVVVVNIDNGFGAGYFASLIGRVRE